MSEQMKDTESLRDLLDWLCESKEEPTKIEIVVNDENVDEFLLGTEVQQLKAMQYLKNCNLRNYIETLDVYFKSDKTHPMVVANLLEACIDQRIMEEFVINKNGYEMYFIPHYLEMPVDQDGVNEALEYLSKWFLTKEPNFYQMCKDVLLQEAYLQLPLMWEEGDGLEVALTIAKYVYKAWGRLEEFDDLCEKEDMKGIKLLDLMVETIEFE